MGGNDNNNDELDQQIEMFKVKKLIKNLEAARGNGTSMISLIIPPGDQISRVNKMLSDEYGTASNIKSRVNRLSVLSAITSTQQRLKLYNKCPPNGLVIYCGTVITEDGKERKVNIDFEPFKPINTSLYLCDNKFHTEDLQELLMDDECFGFIVMDGNGCLYGTVQGSNREIMHKFSVDLPKKTRSRWSIRLAFCAIASRKASQLRAQSGRARYATLCTRWMSTQCSGYCFGRVGWFQNRTHEKWFVWSTAGQNCS